jgi:hypothetical protein
MPSSIFFLEDWRISYSLFQKEISKHFNNGFRWIAHFDLAAYYDTICHDMLWRIAYPRTINENRDLILRYLKLWSSEKILSSHGHGIPQGPIASDFLAECFLLPIDEELQNQKVHYVRYVDDIRLFGRSENEVRASAIRMEILLRERGLIPHSQKHRIMRARTIEDAMGILPSIAPRSDGKQPEEPLFTADGAVKKFRDALSGRPLAIVDKTRAKYVLFHAAPSRRLLHYVLCLMPRHPEHIDAFAYYLRGHTPTRTIVNACTDLLKTSPYEYVKGEIWHLFAEIMQPSEMRPLVRLAINTAKDKKTCFAFKWGALHFLCIAERARLGKYGKFIMYQDSWLLQALLAPVLPDARFMKGDVAEKMLRRSAFEPGLALAEHLVRLRRTPAQLGVKTNSLPSQVRNTLRALGLVSRRSPSVDPMGEILSRRYGVQRWDGWKVILGIEYSHALQLLIIANNAFHIERSQWLSYQNSFNHSLFIAFQLLLQAKGIVGAEKITDKNGQPIKFGVLVDPNQPFGKAHLIIASAFASANSRRNTLPASHPYEQKGGQRTRYLRKNEQIRLVADLSKAYEEIVRIVITNP